MKAEDFTLEDLENIRRFWWDEANSSGRLVLIRELIGSQVFELSHGIKLTPRGSIASSTRADTGQYTGDFEVSGTGNEVVVNTSEGIYVPGTWEGIVKAAHSALARKREDAARELAEQKVRKLRSSLCLSYSDYRSAAEAAIKTIRGLKG